MTSGPDPGVRPGARPGERGFALAAALWILVLVGAVGAAFFTAAQSQRRAVANGVEAARARWAARAGFAQATAALDRQLDDAGAVGSLRAAGDSIVRAVPLELNGVRVEAALLDSRARVHLNRADRRDLVELFTALGVRRPRAVRLSAALADWRDPDARPRADGGAEARDYAALGLPVRPRDGPLPSVEELQRVRGFDRDVFRRLRPYVTVVGDGRVNVNSAPAPVLAVLPALDLAAARALVRARSEEALESAHQVARVLPGDAARRLRSRMDAFSEQVAFGPRFGQLVVRADPPGTPGRTTIRAVVELQGGTDWRIVQTREDG
jgi:general secretion pathway protein K